MNNKKMNQKQSYKKSSVLFMQLGLILALFISYTALEIEMDYQPPTFGQGIEYIDDEKTIIDFILEKKVIPKAKPKQPIRKKTKPIITQTKITNKIDIVDDTKKVVESTLEKTEIEQNEKVNPIKTTSEETKPKIEKTKTFTILGIQEMPTFPGCKGNFDEKKACFELKIKNHIQKHFDNDLAQTLDLEEGKQRISVQFIVDENGNITDIKTRAIHKKLEKEAQRIINKLPKMIPGKQNKKPVRVRYNVPINFQIEH